MNTTLQTYLKAQLDTLHAENLYKPLLTIEGRPGARVNVGGRELINLSSNNYLGLASDPRLCEAASNAALTIGAGSGAVRPIIGNIALHDQLEKLIAEFKHVEDVLVFQSGFTSNAGTIPTIMEAEDAIITDSLNHASIIDGCRLSKAKRSIYQHCDMDSLRDALIAAKDVRKRLIITDGVFSMDGDCPEFEIILSLSEKHKAYVIVDEAHALGVFGSTGEGLMQSQHLQHRIFARIMTFGKGLGCHGAVVLGSQELKQYLVNFARSLIYTTALPPHSVATILVAYRQLEKEKTTIQNLRDNIVFFNQEKQLLGLKPIFVRSKSAIQCAIIPGNEKVKAIAKQLQENGFDVKAILAPTVPEGQERLRFCIHSYNTKEEMAQVLQLLATFVFQ